MIVLIDMGNSRLKWATLTNTQWHVGPPLVNTQINQKTLFALWQSLEPPEQLFISCVTANQTLELIRHTAYELWSSIDIDCVKSTQHAYGITNAYKQPEKLGVDRWLALIATSQLYTLPALIVDCGTAITLDLINAQNQHVGGFICPGLSTMKQSLAQATHALPLIENSYDLTPANQTEAAIYSGTLLATVGLIEQVLTRQQNTNINLILTGGDAELIAQHLNRKYIINTDLVLHGLAIIAKTEYQIAPLLTHIVEHLS